MLKWNANSELDLAGYYIYHGTASRSYGAPMDAGVATTYTVTGLTDGVTYYFGVTARDVAGNESSYSNEVSKTIGGSPGGDTTPPEDVRNFSAVAGDAQVALSWINPLDADYLGVHIQYLTDRYPSGLADGVLLGNFTGQPNAAMNAMHTGLQNGVTYYYAASSYDLSGNFQMTALAAATPTAGQPSPSLPPSDVSSPSSGGGCGVITTGGGEPPATGPMMLNLMPSYLLILLVGMLRWYRKAISRLWLHGSVHASVYPRLSVSAVSAVCSAVFVLIGFRG